MKKTLLITLIPVVLIVPTIILDVTLAPRVFDGHKQRRQVKAKELIASIKADNYRYRIGTETYYCREESSGRRDGPKILRALIGRGCYFEVELRFQESFDDVANVMSGASWTQAGENSFMHTGYRQKIYQSPDKKYCALIRTDGSPFSETPLSK